MESVLWVGIVFLSTEAPGAELLRPQTCLLATVSCKARVKTPEKQSEISFVRVTCPTLQQRNFKC